MLLPAGGESPFSRRRPIVYLLLLLLLLLLPLLLPLLIPLLLPRSCCEASFIYTSYPLLGALMHLTAPH